MAEQGERDFAVEFYWRMREAATGRLSRDAKRRAEKKAKATSQPFERGREPISAGDSLDGLIAAFRWDEQLGEADLFVRWGEVVGELNAAASVPEKIVNGTLTIRCKSTAWASQFRLIQDAILARIQADYPTLEIGALKFLGPDAPSWKKGSRSVPGRGPRDTYG